ncbi:hypothetical protein [Sphingomonas gellani]|uniref:hypothetical protein n=1 Tax=Sphingomonas gellani TaxID=1166340 RepID=UPI00244ED725|nr:hypothetical protein [Sphingomonas gellani]
MLWFVHHLLGSLTFSMAQSGRIDRLSNGACTSTDMGAVLRTSVRIFACGFKGLQDR